MLNRPSIPFRSRDGFALIITVTLLAFLVLLLVSLAALTRVETWVASNSQQLSTARQNALFALNIALGELQKYAGPDQRATARAEILDSSPTPSTSSGARMWTGVWGNAADPQKGVSSTPKLLQWLVSGNHGTNFNPETHVSHVAATAGQISASAGAPGITPSLAINGLSTSATVSSGIAIGGTDAALLVGPATAGTTAGAEARYVAAPLVDIRVDGSAVPGGTPSSLTRIGRYAYWVGDEGVKARVNVVDPYVAPTPQMIAAGNAAEEDSLFRLMSPPRLGVERVTGYENFPVNEDSLRGLLNDSQLGLLDASLTPEVRQARFHDLTTASSGVLADSLRGGLKRDLTYAFARDNLDEYRASLRDPFRAITTGGPNPLLTGALGTNASTAAVTESALLAEQGPTWEQLRSYGRLGSAMDKDDDGNDRLEPRVQTGTEQGIYPILIQARMGFGGRAFETGPAPAPARFENHFYPSFVLANPYNVTIKASKYRVRALFGAGTYAVFIGGQSPAFWHRGLRDLFDGAIFELDCPDLKPGEARVFTLDSSSENVAWAASKVYPMANEWDAGFARIVVPVDEDIDRTVFEGDPVTPSQKKGIHPIFSAEGDGANQQWSSGASGPTPNGARTVDSEMGWALMNEGNEVYQRFDNYKTPAGGATVHQYGYKGALPITAGPQSVLIFRLAETGHFGKATLSYIPQVPVYPYYALGNIRAPMVSRPATYNTFTSTALFISGFEKNASSSATPTFAHWIRLDSVGSGYERVEWQGLRKADQQASLTQARVEWTPADVPRAPDGPVSGLVSIGQLQHFNAGGYNDGHYFPPEGTPVPFATRPSANATWRPRHAASPNPIGNSRANPFVQRDRARHVRSSEPFYDQSYLLNRQLFDGHFFSTYPQAATAVDLRTERLANAKLAPFRIDVAPDDPEQFRGGATFDAADVFLAARNLMMAGGFNANSTSVEAWKAVLGAFAGTRFNGETGLSGPFLRSIHQRHGSAGATDGVSENAWNGFRNLTPAQIDTLAQFIVDEIKRRGISLGLADFISRKLVADTAANAEDGLAGPLQAAIDRAGINNPIAKIENMDGNETDISAVSTHAIFAYPAHLPPHPLEGIAGWLMQADVVQALAPILSARSDTFRIRTYGESRNPATDEPAGRAWCEAIVQRIPDYVDAQANDAADGLQSNGVAVAASNARFGRKFVVIGFRWLNPEDI